MRSDPRRLGRQLRSTRIDAPTRPARTGHDANPAIIALVRVKQSTRDKILKVCRHREDRTARFLRSTRGQFRQFNDEDATDEVRGIVPKERGFGKADRQREVRYHSVRIDAFLSETGRKIDRINSRIGLQAQRIDFAGQGLQRRR